VQIGASWSFRATPPCDSCLNGALRCDEPTALALYHSDRAYSALHQPRTHGSAGATPRQTLTRRYEPALTGFCPDHERIAKCTGGMDRHNPRRARLVRWRPTARVESTVTPIGVDPRWSAGQRFGLVQELTLPPGRYRVHGRTRQRASSPAWSRRVPLCALLGLLLVAWRGRPQLKSVHDCGRALTGVCFARSSRRRRFRHAIAKLANYLRNTNEIGHRGM